MQVVNLTQNNAWTITHNLMQALDALVASDVTDHASELYGSLRSALLAISPTNYYSNLLTIEEARVQTKTVLSWFGV